jgi:hypothetical protein
MSDGTTTTQLDTNTKGVEIETPDGTVIWRGVGLPPSLMYPLPQVFVSYAP